MISAFVFQNKNQFLGEITSDENLLENLLVKKLVATALFVPREVEEKTSGGMLRSIYYEEVVPQDKNYFWAVVEALRQQGLSVYVFEGTRVAVARLILAASIAAEERAEFFRLLLSVPEEQIKPLKTAIEGDINNFKKKMSLNQRESSP